VNSWYSSSTARHWTTAATAPTLAGTALDFHRAFPGYAPTPLVPVPDVAGELGVGRVLVKDESSRLGLPAFKILGASWACRQVLTAQPGATLVAATEGNHGRAVAAMARHFGVPATVFVPQVMLPRTAARIEGEGAEVVRVAGDYDATVRRASEYADAAPGRALVQDTAWPGYQQVPAWIVEGYQTLLAEIDAELGGAPDLVVVPVGVGSLAEAVVRHYRRPGGPRPRLMSAEPDTAACALASLSAGHPVAVPTGATVMAGLNCPTVSTSAWPVLQSGLDAAVAVTDDDARQAMADLDRLGLSSGPCGAATLAAARAALGRDAPPERRTALDLGPAAVAVLLSTEGNTESSTEGKPA